MKKLISLSHLQNSSWIIGCLMISPILGIAQAPLSIYVWEFTTRDGERNELTLSVTEEFEEALIQSECCNIIQRRYYSRLFDQKQNELAVSNLDGIPKATKDGLKSLKANSVVFGEVYDDTNSGQVRISVSIESFEGKILKKASSYLPKFAVFDPSKREEAIAKLMTDLKFSAGKTNTSASNSGKKEVPEEKILGTWIFETQYNHLLHSNGLRKPTGAFYKNAIRFTLEGNKLSGEHLWLETKDDNCGINDLELSGTIIGNEFELIFEFLGNCCKGTKSRFEGEMVSENRLIGKIEPLGLPIGECANGWATFIATREKN